MRYAIIMEQINTGFSAHVPDLPGCVAAGETPEETLNLIREAISLSHFTWKGCDGMASRSPSLYRSASMSMCRSHKRSCRNDPFESGTQKTIGATKAKLPTLNFSDVLGATLAALQAHR